MARPLLDRQIGEILIKLSLLRSALFFHRFVLVAEFIDEAIRRRVALWRGRPDPGPVDMARLLPVAYVVAGALLLMGVIVIWADLVKPISLG